MSASASPTACLREAWSRPSASPPKAAPACAVCAAPIGPRTKTGLCRVHGRTHGTGGFLYPRDCECSVCGVGITRQAKSGMCKPCANRSRNGDPEFRRKVSEGQKRRMQEPEFAAMKRKVAQRNSQKAWLDPDKRDKLVKCALQNLERAHTPEAIERKNLKKAEGHAKRVDKRLSWCPLEFRALHHRNVASKRMRAADSRKIIEAMIADREALHHVDSALDYLRRFAPVQKLENGYRVGFSDVLSPSEIVHRAESRGWEPERWAA